MFQNFILNASITPSAAISMGIINLMVDCTAILERNAPDKMVPYTANGL